MRCMGGKSNEKEVKDDSGRKGARHTRYSLSCNLCRTHKNEWEEKWKGEQSASFLCVMVLNFLCILTLQYIKDHSCVYIYVGTYASLRQPIGNHAGSVSPLPLSYNIKADKL